MIAVSSRHSTGGRSVTLTFIVHYTAAYCFNVSLGSQPCWTNEALESSHTHARQLHLTTWRSDDSARRHLMCNNFVQEAQLSVATFICYYIAFLKKWNFFKILVLFYFPSDCFFLPRTILSRLSTDLHQISASLLLNDLHEGPAPLMIQQCSTHYCGNLWRNVTANNY